VEPADVESLERATVEAVAPPQVLEIDGWLVPLDDGTIGRAKSAVPLRHDAGVEALNAIEAAYRERGLKPAFRIADLPSLGPVRAALADRGYAVQQSTVVKTGVTSRLATFSEASARILSKPDDAWAAVFLGQGFDPVDGAHRVAALSRAPDAIYAAAGEAGETHAVGVMTFGHGWAGVHGMRTAQAHRGKGYASAILGALGRAARDRGVGRVLLDVEEANPARRIYRAAGFSAVWRYQYWR
jgi:GNAT superfamily N-acetyltransferase